MYSNLDTCANPNKTHLQELPQADQKHRPPPIVSIAELRAPPAVPVVAEIPALSPEALLLVQQQQQIEMLQRIMLELTQRLSAPATVV
jgi:hypothetical protein